ncbi:MAG: AbrB/MazE/SpoVT family DNA-binding domain-containing protein [Anaerolineae bacterium]
MSVQRYIMPVTSKGQVTIPVAIRRLLGLGKNAKVAFKVEGDTVTVEHARSSLQAVYGAVEPRTRPEDFERITEIAHEDQALKAMRDGE